MPTLSLDAPRVQAQLLQLHDSRDLNDLWHAAQGVFREVVPDDALSIYLNYFDFSKSWKASAVLATLQMAKSAAWHESRRKVEVTTPFLQLHPKVSLYRLSDIFASPGEFRGSPLFQDFMRPHGWHDSVGLVYRRGSSVNSVISLRRPADRGDYCPEEMRMLRKLHPHFESVIKRILANKEERARLVWLEKFSEHLPYVMLQLDWDLQPTYANREAMKQCCIWNFGPKRAASYNARAEFRLPEPVLNACRELRECWLRQASQCPDAKASLSVKLAHPREPALTATVTLQISEGGGSTLPRFTVGFAPPGGHRAADPAAMMPEVNLLTAAERELVTLVGQGCSNKEAALQLGKSSKTVAGQLTSIYRKLGVTGRSRLIAALN